MTAALRRLQILLLLIALPSAASAHRLDEYLQATLVAIEPGAIHLQFNLTPGVAIADQVLAQIDRNQDGVISPEESAAYADLLQRDLTVRLDQRTVELKRTTVRIPAPSELHSGEGIIQIEFSLAPISLPPGTHRLTLDNRHQPSISVYLLNAAQPRSNSIRITKQIRTENQSSGEIEFKVDNSAHFSVPIPLLIALAFLVLGVVVGLWRTRKPSSLQRPG